MAKPSAASPGAPRRPAPDPRGEVAARVAYLFDVLRAPSGRRFSAAEVARWVRRTGGQLTAVHLLKILSGERPNPSPAVQQQLARFFAVPAAVLLEHDPPEIDLDLARAHIALRDERARQLLARFSLLSAGSQAALLEVMDRLLIAEQGRGAKT